MLKRPSAPRMLLLFLVGVFLASMALARQNDDIYIAPFPPLVPVFNGTAMVSLPAMADLLATTVSADDTAQQYSVTCENHRFSCSPAQTQAKAGEKTLELALAPYVQEHELYVPLIPLVESMGGTVTQADNTATIILPNQLLPISLPMFPVDIPLKKYAAGMERDEDLYVVNIDGTGLRRLTHHACNEVLPVFSPDGRLCLYLDFEGRLCLRPTGMTQAQPLLLPSPEAYQPDWIDYAFLEDGQTVALTRQLAKTMNGEEQWEMTLYTLDGRKGKSYLIGEYAVISPAANCIAYTRGELEAQKDLPVELLDLATGNRKALGKGNYPSFSPDGKWLSWMGACQTEYGVVTVNYTYALTGDHAGTTYTPAAATHSYDYEAPATFCPDGKHIIYWQDGPGFWIDTIERTDARKLVIDDIERPTFTPDGQHLLCTRGNHLCLLRSDGTEVNVLINNMQVEEYRLLPDGKHIVFRAERR